MTIRDIAAEANVSVATVSRVLNGNAPVKESTRQRIEKVMEKHDYRPNEVARSLSKQETQMIGLIVPDITNPFFSSITFEVQNYAMICGYSVLLSSSLNNRQLESKSLQVFSRYRVDGIMLMGGRINDTKPLDIHVEELNDILNQTPIVMINGQVDGVDCHHICADEAHGMRLLVEYLVSLGHTNIGLLGGVVGHTTVDWKLNILKETLNENGIQFNPKYFIPSDLLGYSIEAGVSSMTKLLERKPLPSAIIAINDLVAFGAIKAIHNHGLLVPDDISVVGFDNIQLAKFGTPSLTTIDQNPIELSRSAVDVLRRVIDGEEVPKHTRVEVDLVVRNSCRSLR